MTRDDYLSAVEQKSQQKFGRIAAVYLLGLLIGGLYVGLIAPVRTVIQAGFGIDNSIGIWMVNIYTLFYAALIPTSGKLADRYGRKHVFSACMLVFGTGALMCGISQIASSFPLLLVGRIVQAAGAGGVIPVATTEMGVSAPEGKRGMWLGMAAAVSGISNVLGAAVGSLVVSLVGVEQWGWAFFMCVPVCLLLFLGALLWLPTHETEAQGKLDIGGSVVFTAFLLALLLGLMGIDFFDLAGTLLQPTVVCWLLVALVLAIVFRMIEQRASDPIFHMEYLHNRNIVLLLVSSLFVGGCIISMVMIPEFAEAALGVSTGSGGYYMAVIGIFAIVGPPVGGKIIDRIGAKPVFICGSVISMLGYLFLALFVANHPSVPAMLLGLCVVGLGMGFTMGTPLNYLMLQSVPKGESTSAIATMSLVRQIGTTVAPALLVGFISAGSGLGGYSMMLVAVAVFSLLSILALLPFKETR